MKFWNLLYGAWNLWKFTSVLFWVKRKREATNWQAETHPLYHFWVYSISTSGNTENPALGKLNFRCFLDSIRRLQCNHAKYQTRCVRSWNFKRIGWMTRKIQPFETSWHLCKIHAFACLSRCFMIIFHPPTHIIRAHASTLVQKGFFGLRKTCKPFLVFKLDEIMFCLR